MSKHFLFLLFVLSSSLYMVGQEVDKPFLNGIFKSAQNGCKYFHYNDSSSSLLIDTVPLINISEFKFVKKKYNKQFKHYELLITLTDNGADRFAKVSKENIGQPLAIIIDNKLLSAPIVRQEITGGKLMLTGLEKQTIKDILSFFNSK